MKLVYTKMLATAVGAVAVRMTVGETWGSAMACAFYAAVSFGAAGEIPASPQVMTCLVLEGAKTHVVDAAPVPAPAPGPEDRKIGATKLDARRRRSRARSESDDEDEEEEEVPAAALPNHSNGVAAAAAMPPAVPAAATVPVALPQSVIEAMTNVEDIYGLPEWTMGISDEPIHDGDDPEEYHAFNGWWDEVMKEVMPRLTALQRSHLMRALMFTNDLEAYKYAQSCMIELELEHRRKALAARKDKAWGGVRDYWGDLMGHFLLPEDIQRLRTNMQRARGRRVGTQNNPEAVDEEIQKLEEEFRARCKTELRKTCRDSRRVRGLQIAGTAAAIAAGVYLDSKKEREEKAKEAAKAEQEEQEETRKSAVKKQRTSTKRDRGGNRKGDPKPDSEDGSTEGGGDAMME